MFKLGSGDFLSGLLFDGNGKGATDGKGEYGLIMPFSQAMLVENVHVLYFRTYSVILDRAQNSALLKVNGQFNSVNFLFNNGARNMVLVGCNAAVDLRAGTGRILSHRNIFMEHIQDNPLLSKKIGQTNSLIQILGGIYEYAHFSDANVEILKAGTRGFNDILFQGCEFTEAKGSGYLLKIEQGSVKMHNCEFNRKDSAKTIYIGNKSTLTLPADGSFGSGGRGKLAPLYGIDVVPGGMVISGAPGEGLPAANIPLTSDTRGWQS